MMPSLGLATSPLAVFLALLTTTELGAQDQNNGDVDFARDILPLLSNKCFVCHGPDAKKKDLVRLDSFAGATRDLGGYRAIDPASPGKSEILARIHDPDDPMPPRKSGKTLTDDQRDLLRRWIAQGGEYARHWSFVPPTKGKAAQRDGSPRDVIDAEIGSLLRSKKIDFAEPADRRTLARRVALVLTGLPPEPELLRSYLSDERDGAYERLVDALLASPRFGEHQARYWLDAVRYGDTHGLHLDNRRGIYPYRDWVVRAFNDNLPLDDFITWQLAGDLLPDPTLAQRVATGYVRMNPSTAEGGVIPAEFQAKNNFDRTETLGTVMLGLTMTCARCHTHKYDPISHTEYYELFAFFNSTAESPLDGNRYDYAPVVRAPADQRGWSAWSELESEIRALVDESVDVVDAARVQTHAEAAMRFHTTDWKIQTTASGAATPAKGLPGVMRKVPLNKGDEVFIEFRAELAVDQAVTLSCSGGPGSTVRVDAGAATPFAERIHLELAKGTHDIRLALVAPRKSDAVDVRIAHVWKDWRSSGAPDRLRMVADRQGPFRKWSKQDRAVDLVARLDAVLRGFTTTLVTRELPQPRKTQLLRRGEYDLPTGEPLQPETPDVLGKLPKDAPRNRLGLARWLTAPEHPLVSRVFVNRIWQRVFGYGLVRTPEDFGLQGEQPTHPALLDWLAVDLRESGWDMKRMIRAMVTSRTFRQRSAWRNDVDDPENRLWARGPGHRLDAEEIRDIALWASGLLDPAMGGEGVKPYQPEGMWAALAHPASNTKRYVPDHGEKLYRRSLYVYWKRTSPHPMMTLFDAPSRESSCVRRSRTSTPLQSLGLLNETQRLETARAFAKRLLRDRTDDARRLDLLFELLACREPTARERTACERMLAGQHARHRNAEDTEHAEHIAWSQLVISVMASDIALSLY